jgi:UDP-2,3-diacylglucosamine hydrolase
MLSNHYDAPVRALFLADCHFHVERDAAEESRLRAFVDLLDRHPGVPDVVLLGDIFDFWFDYAHFYMKGYEDLLQALDRLRDSGSRLHFVGGNHDIWAAGYMHRRYGTAPQGGPVTLTLDGHRIHCIHGDGVIGRDVFYRSFRAIVRHPVGVAIGKSLHPELLFAFSSWLSKTSRGSTRDEAAGIETKAGRWLAHQRSPGWDHIVLGHVHHPYTVEHAGRTLTTLGGWFETLNYAVWQEDRLRQLRWRSNPDRDRRAGY